MAHCRKKDPLHWSGAAEGPGAVGHPKRLALDDGTWCVAGRCEGVPGDADHWLPPHAAIAVQVALSQANHPSCLPLLRRRVEQMIRME